MFLGGFCYVNLINIHCSYWFLIENKNKKAWWCYHVRKAFPIQFQLYAWITTQKWKIKSRQNFEAVVQYTSLAHNKRNSPLRSPTRYNLSSRFQLLLIRYHVIHTKDLLSCMNMHQPDNIISNTKNLVPQLVLHLLFL